ncbi:MAG: hypothetical protein LBP62_07485 [Clostridiales bacterium]|jgi:UPF0716 family protein affecting phage T7 exclusion|nr:hypothetical protein [Clostridiales bacterium]
MKLLAALLIFAILTIPAVIAGYFVEIPKNVMDFWGLFIILAFIEVITETIKSIHKKIAQKKASADGKDGKES